MEDLLARKDLFFKIECRVLYYAPSWKSVCVRLYEDASFMDVMSVFLALEIKIQGNFLVPLDILRRTPVTKEELLSSSKMMERSLLL
jgi:hypothetical protein